MELEILCSGQRNYGLDLFLVPLPQWCAIQHTTELVPSPEKRRVGVRKGIRS